MDFLKKYWDCEGPLGFPMKDQDAKALEIILNEHPDHTFERLAIDKAMTEIQEGERADVSWISTEDLDRDREIVLAAGMDESHFKNNPIVTMGHNYKIPPVGRSLWRRKVKDGDRRGIKAKTQYPMKPEDWPEPTWPPDIAFQLIKSGLMVGKSIGFVTLEGSAPTPEEVKKNPQWADAKRIIRRWLLLEYCVHWLPVNQHAIVEEISKGTFTPDTLKGLGIEVELPKPPDPPPPASPIGFTTEEEIQRRVTKALKSIDLDAIQKRAIQDTIDRLSGRV
jgi:hypothetical protein